MLSAGRGGAWRVGSDLIGWEAFRNDAVLNDAVWMGSFFRLSFSFLVAISDNELVLVKVDFDRLGETCLDSVISS